MRILGKNGMIKGLLAAGAAVMLGGTMAQAAVISVNFATNNSTDVNRANGIVDSVGAVPSPNWNNVYASVGVLPTPGTLNDDSGNATTLTFSASGGGMDTWNTYSSTDDNLNINSDWINFQSTPKTVTFGSVPYANYDLYVYANSYGGAKTVAYTIGTDTETLNDDGNPPTGKSPALQQGVNYVKFTGLSGDATMAVAPISGSPAALGGFQIVETQTPEPTSLSLLGIGAMGLLARRRRKA